MGCKHDNFKNYRVRRFRQKHILIASCGKCCKDVVFRDVAKEELSAGRLYDGTKITFDYSKKYVDGMVLKESIKPRKACQNGKNKRSNR